MCNIEIRLNNVIAIENGKILERGNKFPKSIEAAERIFAVEWRSVHIQEKMSSIKNKLPWRLRRSFEKFQFQSYRFQNGLKELHIRNGSPAASLVATGDIALCGTIGEGFEQSKVIEFASELQILFSQCDLRIGNLETMLTDAVRNVSSIGSFLNAPKKTVSLLKAIKFDILNLANNHARDCCLSGLLQCCQVLSENGIQYCGVGPTIEKSRSPAITNVGGVKVGVLGYCDNFRVDAKEAENVTPAPALDEFIKEDILALRRHVDLVILQLHWGWEFSFYPPLSYRNRARHFAEIGADLVLCHHAHVPMGVEVWKTSLIAHGLGNFIFPYNNNDYFISGNPWTNRTIVLKVLFDKSGLLRAEIIPFVINTHGLPNIATGHYAAEILGGVGRASSRLADDELLAWVERDRTVRETASFFRAVQKSDPVNAQEWSLQLLSLIYQDIIGRLEENYGSEGEQIAFFMRQFGVNHSDPQLARSYVKKSRDKEVLSALAGLLEAHPFFDDVPGRLP